MIMPAKSVSERRKKTTSTYQLQVLLNGTQPPIWRQLKFLKGEDDHLLDGPSPAYPEVEQFLSTDNVPAPPTYPSGALVEGSDGNLYGTTAYGGPTGGGTVFRVTTNGVLATLVSFNGTNGSHPVAVSTAPQPVAARAVVRWAVARCSR
jgi:uncharacterized repeat protein (TIGR03803 family)